MATFEQFLYKECLPVRSINALPEVLRIKNRNIEEVLLLRLITGTVTIKNVVNNAKIDQRINYSKIDYGVNSRLSAKNVLDFFSSESIPIRRVESYYAKSIISGNKVFFKNLLLEITNYFYQKDKKSYATAFLHLYRSIELISYCFPLHYASKATSYEKTYNRLKDYFNKADGELSFFKIFVNDHLFKNNPTILDIHLPILIRAPKPELQAQYYKAIKKLCDKNGGIEIKSSIPGNEIVITRRGLLSLTFDLRNRYFHLLSGDYNDNFSSKELAEIDLFYLLVNDTILNWIVMIYLEILKESINQ